VFDEKANKVIIVVVCCSPEKIQKKICSKGGGVIKSVEIVQPKKPVEKPGDPVEKKKEAEKPKEQEKNCVFMPPRWGIACRCAMKSIN